MVFWATTPPQIKLTKTTDAKGVNRPTKSANSGNLPRNIIPVSTGNKTTFAVAAHKDTPETCIGLLADNVDVVVEDAMFPINLVLRRCIIVISDNDNLTRNGVMNTAMMVEQDVNNTDKATFAPAIKDTKFDAVPPGEQPTKIKPKNSSGPIIFPPVMTADIGNNSSEPTR